MQIHYPDITKLAQKLNDLLAVHLVVMRGVVTRISDKDGKVVYNIGETEPMSMSMVADVLEVERNHCYRAFQKFQALVFEQIAAIEAADATE